MSKTTPRIKKAIEVATKAHEGQLRKTGEPYIIHPLAVMKILEEWNMDEDTIIAGLLHDTVEDTSVTLDDISREFGPRVAKLVEEESDVFMEGVSEADSWHERKQAAIDRLSHASRDAKMVALGDKLSNARIIYRDFVQKGDKLWSIFHVTDVKEHEWHYRGLASSLKELEGTFAYTEFTDLVEKIFGGSTIK